MARLATSAAHFYQRLQEIYPQKLLLIKNQSEQSSPFRRWTTGSGAGSSYRHHDHRNMYNKQISEGAVGSGAGGAGGVARWSLGLEQLLADPAGAAAFAHFLSKEFAAENIRFWWSCEQYSNTQDASERAALAAQIWQRHLDEKAPEPVNVDAAARRAAALRLCSEPAAVDLFQQAQKQIFNVMKFDSYPRFLRSGVHAECARADLCGLPPPYAPQLEHNTPTKLKKSASNASERRRSGGASLLPWKLRAPSRDRAPPAPPPPAPPAHTDVVKCSQWSGQCSLCRVVLPDGATSVVGVEPAVSVRQLVERLLHRRNLACDTYDVVLRDADKGESSNIDLNAPSSTIGGKEVRVERRVVLRIEVGGRCVAVRCGRARRLRHVLRPLLARYLPAPRLLAVLERDGCVRPDARVQELEGVRLQVIELPDVKEYNSSGQLVPCVAVIRAPHQQDTGAEANHRLDDAQSISVANSSSRSRDYSSTNGITDSISLPTTNGCLGIDNCSVGDNNSIGSNSSTIGNNDNGLGNSNNGIGNCNSTFGNCNSTVSNSSSTISNSGISGLGNANSALGNANGGVGNNNNSCASNGGPNGRVRAALRSGPPLHHHPPDFLENLRETQRQRLNSKTEVCAPAPAPAPRAPPPLPPKPPQRPPTVV